MKNKLEKRAYAKREAVVRNLRTTIIKGKYPASSQLPNQLKLAKDFRVSPVTIQRSIEQLKAEGFLETHERQGVFVAKRAPHTCDYALIFAEDPTTVNIWSRFYTGLQNAAVDLQRTVNCRFLHFYGINSRMEHPDCDHLLNLVLSHRLAGLIFAQGEHLVANTPLMTHPNIARVSLKSRPLFPHVPVITYDIRSSINKALSYLASRGRRRVALITIPSQPEVPQSMEYWFHSEIKKHGIKTRSYWVLQIAAEGAIGARNCTRLLMENNSDQRPDGLIIADDNLVEDTLAGLVAARVNVPNDLDIVAHCNFPWLGLRVMPIKWLGYDCCYALKQCLEVINRQQRGESVPSQTMIPSFFEEEVSIKQEIENKTAVSLSEHTPSQI